MKAVLDVAAKEQGFTLVEAVVAVSILAIVIGGVLALVSGMFSRINTSRDRAQAVWLARRILEDVKGVAQNSKNIRQSLIGEYHVNPDSRQAKNLSIIEQHWDNVDCEERFDLPGYDTSLQVGSGYEGNPYLREVTAVVTWQDKEGQTKRVELKTLVAQR